MSQTTHVRLSYAAVLGAAWLLGLAWAVSSPVGSSPDESFHLASIWCSTGDDAACVETDVTPPDVAAQVPLSILSAGCFAFKPDVSGACTEDLGGGMVPTTWFNVGLYPPTYYSAMSPFVGADVWRSVLTMRIVSMTLAMFVMAISLWASSLLRPSQTVAWAVASTPLWIFLMASVNPSGWGIAGVASMWPAAFALVRAESKRSFALAAAAVALAALISTARGDTAAMAAAVLLGVVLVYVSSLNRWPAVLYSAFVALALGLVFLGSSQTEGLQEGLAGYGTHSGWPLLWSNFMNLPDIWLGAFGATFALGWIDTVMPSRVWYPAVAVASALALFGLARVGARRAVLLAGCGAAIALLPLLTLQRSGAPVGEGVQPRYILPLVVVWLSIALAPLDRGRISLSPPQRWLLTLASIVAASMALHVQLRRYVTGTDVSGFNLNQGAEWSSLTFLGPMGIWVLGTLAATGMFVAVFRMVAGGPAGDAFSRDGSETGSGKVQRSVQQHA